MSNETNLDLNRLLDKPLDKRLSELAVYRAFQEHQHLHLFSKCNVLFYMHVITPLEVVNTRYNTVQFTKWEGLLYWAYV